MYYYSLQIKMGLKKTKPKETKKKVPSLSILEVGSHAALNCTYESERMCVYR
jgi:hypothetical protein